MATTTVSDAVVFGQSQGTGLASEDQPNSAVAFNLLSQYVGGEYVVDDYASGLAFQAHDATNDTVDIGPGACFITDTSTSTAGKRGSGGNPQLQSTSASGYDTEVPGGSPYLVILPTAVTISVGDTQLNDVYLHIDDVTSNNSVSIVHDDGSGVTAPSDTYLKLGATNPDDSTQDTRANDGPLVESFKTDGVTGEVPISQGDGTLAMGDSVGSFPYEVRNAADFTGTNGGAQIQNAINDLPAQGGVVIVGEGPDSGSDVTNASASYTFPSSIWLLTSAVTLPDNVCLYLLNSAFLALQDGADDNIIRNADTTNGNDNIAVVGDGNARLHGNPNNQTLDESGNQLERLGIRLYKVKNPILSGIRVGPTHGYGIQVENPTRGDTIDSVPRVESIGLEQDGTTANQDGIHTVAPFNGFLIRDVHGSVGDDGIVINADDGGGHIIVGDGGDARALKASQIHIRSATGKSALFATVPDAEDTHIIRNIAVGPGTYDNAGNGGSAIKWGATNGHSMNAHRGIAIRDITTNGRFVRMRGEGPRDVTMSGCVAPQNLWDAGGSNSKNIRISNSHIIGGTDYVARIGGNVTVEDLVFENCGFIKTGTTGNTAIELRGNNSDTHRGFRLRNCYFENWGTAFAIETGAVLDDVRLEANRYQGNTTDKSLNASPVIINNHSQEAAGSGNTPTAANYQEGDLVENTDDNTVHQLQRDGTWLQLA